MRMQRSIWTYTGALSSARNALSASMSTKVAGSSRKTPRADIATADCLRPRQPACSVAHCCPVRGSPAGCRAEPHHDGAQADAALFRKKHFSRARTFREEMPFGGTTFQERTY